MLVICPQQVFGTCISLDTANGLLLQPLRIRQIHKHHSEVKPNIRMNSKSNKKYH